MIAQLTKGEKGIVEYLQTDYTKHSVYSRDENHSWETCKRSRIRRMHN